MRERSNGSAEILNAVWFAQLPYPRSLACLFALVRSVSRLLSRTFSRSLACSVARALSLSLSISEQVAPPGLAFGANAVGLSVPENAEVFLEVSLLELGAEPLIDEEQEQWLRENPM